MSTKSRFIRKTIRSEYQVALREILKIGRWAKNRDRWVVTSVVYDKDTWNPIYTFELAEAYNKRLEEEKKTLSAFGMTFKIIDGDSPDWAEQLF